MVRMVRSDARVDARPVGLWFHPPPVKFTPASSRSCSRQPQLDSMSALARSRGSGQPHGRLRRVGCHQAEAAAASFDFSATIFDFSAATDEAPHEDSVVRAPAAHRECGKILTCAQAFAMVAPDTLRPHALTLARLPSFPLHVSQVSSRGASASSTPSRPNFRAGFAST